MGDTNTMTRALITIKAANIEDARLIAQSPPFNVPAADAETLFIPANEQRSEDSFTTVTPATLFWASGQFSDEHFAAMSAQSAGLDWASVDAYDSLNDPEFPQRRLAELQVLPVFSAPKR